MNPAHIKTTMAALARAGTLPELRTQPAITMSASPMPRPVAGAAPQGAAPSAPAAEAVDWGGIVADLNATLPTAGATPSIAVAVAGKEAQAGLSLDPDAGAAAGSHADAGFSWDDIVAGLNATLPTASGTLMPAEVVEQAAV